MIGKASGYAAQVEKERDLSIAALFEQLSNIQELEKRVKSFEDATRELLRAENLFWMGHMDASVQREAAIDKLRTLLEHAEGARIHPHGVLDRLKAFEDATRELTALADSVTQVWELESALAKLRVLVESK